MQGTRSALRFAARQVFSRRYAHHGHEVKGTYSDLPSPAGSWQTHYDAQQRKYNLALLGGLAIFASTLVVGKSAGFFDFYNDYPARPADIENYKD